MTVRVVFDCMIFLQGAARPGSPARACFQTVDDGLAILHTSPAILAEVHEVLSRPELVQRFPVLSSEWVSNFVGSITAKSLVVPDVPNAFRLPRDPKDEPYINLAIAIQADFLVTRDRDLLELMMDAGFRSRFPTLQIVDPVSYLQAIRPTDEPRVTGS